MADKGYRVQGAAGYELKNLAPVQFNNKIIYFYKTYYTLSKL